MFWRGEIIINFNNILNNIYLIENKMKQIENKKVFRILSFLKIKKKVVELLKILIFITLYFMYR